MREIDGLYHALAHFGELAALARTERAGRLDLIDGNVHGLASLLHLTTDRPPLRCVWAQHLANDGYAAAAAALLEPLGLDAAPWLGAATISTPMPRADASDADDTDDGAGVAATAADVPNLALPLYRCDAPVVLLDTDAAADAFTADLQAALAGSPQTRWPALPPLPEGVAWVAGMDLEWQPSLLRRRRAGRPPALFQLALAPVTRAEPIEAAPSASPWRLAERSVFLLDLLQVTPAAVERLLAALFGAPHILKTGTGAERSCKCGQHG